MQKARHENLPTGAADCKNQGGSKITNKKEKHFLVFFNKQEEVLMRNFDYVEELIRRDNSQAVILQMSGYFK